MISLIVVLQQRRRDVITLAWWVNKINKRWETLSPIPGQQFGRMEKWEKYFSQIFLRPLSDSIATQIGYEKCCLRCVRCLAAGHSSGVSQGRSDVGWLFDYFLLLFHIIYIFSHSFYFSFSNEPLQQRDFAPTIDDRATIWNEKMSNLEPETRKLG